MMLSSSPIVADRVDWQDNYVAQEAFARDFLANYPGTETLQSGASELDLMQIRYGLASTHTRFQQSWEGLPVFESYVSVHQGPDGAVQNVFDQAFDKLIVRQSAQTPTISFAHADYLGQRFANVELPWMKTTGELVWYAEKGGTARLAWDLVVTAVQPLGQFHTLIDAVSGKLILQRNELEFDTGSGQVFDPNPYQTQGNGTGMVDNNDANNAQLTAQLQTVTLLGLDSGTGYLNGEFVNLASLNSTTVPDVDANEPSRVYNYTRDDDRFEQVVVYYSVDSMNRYFHVLGFDDHTGTPNGIRDFPTLANAHWYTADNSFYSTADDAIHFGDGGVDDAEDADVIAHEYGHAVQHDQNAAWGGGEMGAMGEGFGDYLAASFYADRGDPAFQALNAAAVAEWDATSYSSTNPPALRRVDGNKIYPDDLVGEVHDDGEIWSRALWDIRTALGGPTADTIILESHFGLAANATMPMGAEAILLADQNINGGANQAAIRQAFVDRGILEPPQTIGTVTLNKNYYNIGDLVSFTVVDANGIAPVEVTVTTSAGDSELVTLTDNGGGVYTGSIGSLAGAVTASSGQLEVAIGDVITVTYNDPDDGSGGTSSAFDTAVVSNVHEYPSTNVPVSISDNTTVTSTINVPDVAIVLDVDVQLNITHTYDADLDVFLIAPDGTRVELFTDVGGSGDNFNNTILDDEAGTSITAGTAPFAGSFRPEGSLATLDGKIATGIWTLEITDDAGGDIGSLNSWSLFIDLQDATAGTLSLDQNSYQLGDTVTVSVFDSNAITPVLVDITTNGGDAETLTLADLGGGHFEATISTVAGSVTTGDGTIQGAAGQVMTFSYFDADNGSGGTLTAVANANFTNVIQFPSTNVPVAISDNTTVTSTINITNAGLIADVDVQLNITHTWDSDLDVYLIAPDGTRIELFTSVGGSGDNFNNTILDDEASTSIASGSAPFAGRYAPEGSLAVVDGDSITGLWTLEIRDHAAGDIGSLNSWSLWIDVIPVVVAAPTHIDFGTATSPIANGFAAAGTDVYSNGAGYGWQSGAIGLSTVNRNLGTPLTRDVALLQNGVFLADVPDGTYDVTLWLGDTLVARDQMQVSIEGNIAGVFSSTAGTVAPHTFRAAVNDGQLSIALTDLGGSDAFVALAGISFAPADQYRVDFGTSTSPVQKDFVAGTTANHDGTNSFGWLPGAINLGSQSATGGTSLTRDQVTVADGTFELEVANGSYEVSIDLGDLVVARDLMNIYLEGTLVDTVSTAAGDVVGKTYLVNVTDGLLSIRFQDAGGSDPLVAVAGIEVLSAPPANGDLRFDFGPLSSEVRSGYIGVRNSNYSAALGYGWTFPAFARTTTFSQSYGNSFERDFVRLQDGTFRANVPNGTYDVSFSIGDVTRTQLGISVFIENQLIGTYSTVKGEVRTETARVRVNDGQVTVRYETTGLLSSKYVAATGLSISEADEWHFDMGTATSPVQSGFVRASTGLSSTSNSFGWLPGSANLAAFDRNQGTSFSRDLVNTTDGTFVADLADGSYQVTVSLGDPAGMQDQVRVYLEGTQVATVTTTFGGTVSQSYIVNVTDGQLNLRLAPLGLGEPFASLIGLDIEPIQGVSTLSSGKIAGGEVVAGVGISSVRESAREAAPIAQALPTQPSTESLYWDAAAVIVLEKPASQPSPVLAPSTPTKSVSLDDVWELKVSDRSQRTRTNA